MSTAGRAAVVGTASALVAACLFAMLGPFARFATEAGVDGIAFTMWRAMLGAVALAVGVALRGGLGASRAALAGLDRHSRISLAVAAVMGLTLNAAIFTAYERIPIALALILFYTYPAGVATVDVLLGRERLTPLRAASLGLASGGVVLVLAGGLGPDGGEGVEPLGVLLALSAAASQVVFITVSRTGYRSVPADTSIVLILGTSAVGALVLAPLAGQWDALLVPLASLDPWPVLLLAGVASAGISSILFLTSIRLLGGTRTGILMLAEPVIGAVLAALWLGEALVPLQGVGGVLVLAGATILQLRSAPDHAPVTEDGAAPLA
ncbi:MAG: DMT family transporter [Dehalococcoidia bacterium]